MTTPAHCTRTDPHPAHDLQPPRGQCPGVKPCGHQYQPPRRHCVRGDRIVECDLPTGHEEHHQETATGNVWPLFPWERPGVEPPANGASLVCFGVPDGPAPAGLTPQEIRPSIAQWARVNAATIVFGAVFAGQDFTENCHKVLALAEVIEHGDDETPALLDPMLQHHLEQAEARAEQAEYRIGLVLRVLDRAGDEAPGIDAEIRRILAGDEIPDERSPE